MKETALSIRSSFLEQTQRLAIYLFLALTIADLISTVIGLNLGLVEAGPSASLIESVSVGVYGLLRIGSAAVTLLLFRGVALLFGRYIEVELPIAMGMYLLIVLLALTVINNVVKVLIVL